MTPRFVLVLVFVQLISACEVSGADCLDVFEKELPINSIFGVEVIPERYEGRDAFRDDVREIFSNCNVGRLVGTQTTGLDFTFNLSILDYAVVADDEELIDQIVGLGVDPTGNDVRKPHLRGQSAIHMAVLVDADKSVRGLLKYLESPDVVDEQGHTPIMYVDSTTKRGLTILGILIQAGSDLNYEIDIDELDIGVSVTEYALYRRDLEKYKILVACGADDPLVIGPNALAEKWIGMFEYPPEVLDGFERFLEEASNTTTGTCLYY